MAFDYKNEYSRYKKYYQSLGETIQKPKNRAYSATVFSFLAVSLFGWYAIRPTIQTILYLRREIKDNVVVSQKMEEKISALVEAQALYQEVQPQLSIVNQSLPPSPEVMSLVAQLRNLANSTNASLSAITIPTVPLAGQDATRSAQQPGAGRGPTTPKPAKLNEFPISIQLSGTFATIQSFLGGINTMRRLTSVDTLTLIPSRDSGIAAGTNMLQLTLKLKGYYITQ